MALLALPTVTLLVPEVGLAMVPKARSWVADIEAGVTMVAEALATAVCCVAAAWAEVAATAAAAARAMMRRFILVAPKLKVSVLLRGRVVIAV